MSVHEKAARGFATASENYVSGRPDYPIEITHWLKNIVGIQPNMSVLDVGSGTGKFLPVLRACDVRIRALEPVATMRDQLVKLNPDIEAINGTADSIPLPDGSIDAITCAQAFHWFANAKTLAEFARVLVDGGKLVLVWNGRDDSVPWVKALSVITDELQSDVPRYQGGSWRDAFPADGFEFFAEHSLRNDQLGAPEDIILKRTLSISFIAALPDAERQQVEERVRLLIANTPGLADQSQVIFPYVTNMYAYRKTS